MLKTNVGQVRSTISKHIGSKVIVRCNLGRHKVDVTKGVITDTYPSIFLVKVDDNSDKNHIVSYSYTDLLTEDVKMTLAKA